MHRIFSILIYLYLFLLSPLTYAFTSEIEVNSFDQLQNEIQQIDNNTLVIIDIDGVILSPSDSFFSVQNREKRRQVFKKLENDYGVDGKKRLVELTFAQIQYKLLDPSFINFFITTRNSGATIIALTSMGPNNRYIDQEQQKVQILKNMGFIFDGLGQHEFKIINKEGLNPIMIDGVGFAKGVSKGEIIKEYLKDKNFSKVIMIDDMTKNLISVQKCVSELVPELVLVKYDFVEKIQPINQILYDFQIDYLIKTNIWLDDVQGLIALKAQK